MIKKEPKTWSFSPRDDSYRTSGTPAFHTGTWKINPPNIWLWRAIGLPPCKTHGAMASWGMALKGLICKLNCLRAQDKSSLLKSSQTLFERHSFPNFKVLVWGAGASWGTLPGQRLGRHLPSCSPSALLEPPSTIAILCVCVSFSSFCLFLLFFFSFLCFFLLLAGAILYSPSALLQPVGVIFTLFFCRMPGLQFPREELPHTSGAPVFTSGDPIFEVSTQGTPPWSPGYGSLGVCIPGSMGL